MPYMGEPVLYLSSVIHRRYDKHAMHFDYRIFRMLLDVDELEKSASGMRLFSIDRWNLFSFRRHDHGPRDGSALRSWAEALLQAHDIDTGGGKILLLAMPRLFGYAFNPLSIWYCHHRDGSLRAVLAEVNNTFGEHHFYLLCNGASPLTWPVTQSVEKVFHVSPLMGMEGRYAFRLAEPSDRLSVLIKQFQNGELTLVASQQGEGYALNDKRLLAALFQVPFMTLKVMAAIHWQALRIWLRGAPFFPKPPAPAEKVTQ